MPCHGLFCGRVFKRAYTESLHRLQPLREMGIPATEELRDRCGLYCHGTLCEDRQTAKRSFCYPQFRYGGEGPDLCAV